MEMKRLVCTRNECPDTCFLCEQEGKDYCMICADACTETEYQETYKEHTPVKIADIFFWEYSQDSGGNNNLTQES